MMLEPAQACWISGWGATHEKGESPGDTGLQAAWDRAWGLEVGGLGVNPGSINQ